DGAVVNVSEPLPAGGADTPWATIVPHSDRQHGAVTLVASTGGHLTAHERFAVVGVEADG
ncbi:MAG: hypothetical protein QOI15_1960, partial [Pseudonocardiales bacterium]|nr:hypothetical protein [Pseudonocardiales bacterium]